MKFLFKIIFVFFLPVVIFSQDYYPGLLVIKARSNSKLPEFLAANSKAGKLGYILGKTEVKPACNPKLLDFIEGKNFQHGSKPEIKKYAESVRKIYIVKYSSPVDPLYASAKLRNDPDIEFIEPLYIKHVVDYPNDTLVKDQYYLYTANIFNAWDIVLQYTTDTTTVLAGVIDTGVDYDHPDLANNIWTNPGETGTDSTGHDKSTNGIDDDNNGFIDDWHGWDFVGESYHPDSTGDNNPRFGNPHGTMVAGIIGAERNNIAGIAGVGIHTKILPIKIGTDSQFDGNTYNSYQGLIYAAAMGCDVINVSWGDWNYSSADKEFTDLALATGTAIIAAAGNDGKDIDFYPASFPGVMSVSATDRTDSMAHFGNYTPNVDVCSPGLGLKTIFPLDNYTDFSGTSASTPLVTAIATLVKNRFPNLYGSGIIKRLKATAYPIFDLNPDKKGLIGTGRVDAYKAVTDTLPKLIEAQNVVVTDGNNDGFFIPGEKIKISFTLKNTYAKIDSVTVSYQQSNLSGLINSNEPVYVGKLDSGAAFGVENQFEFTLPDEIDFNYQGVIVFKVSAQDSSEWYFSTRFLTNPSYVTINSNRIATTVTSQGNFSFNDFPSNKQGIGYTVDGSVNLTFECGLIIAASESKVSSVVRGSKSLGNDKEFIILDNVKKSTPGTIAATEATTSFTDINDTARVGVKVIQHVYQFDEKYRSNFIITVYDIINESGVYYDSLYAGLYTDWDISDQGKFDIAAWDSTFGFGYAMSTTPGKKMGGIKLLSDIPVNFFAIDNNGNTDDNPGVYDGFPNNEKWKLISGGIKRSHSDTTDVSMLISAGPIAMRNGDTARVVFALLAGDSLDDLRAASAHAEAIPATEINFNPPYYVFPHDNSIATVFPNPTDGKITVELKSAGEEPLTLSLYDITGKLLETFFENKQFPRTIKRFEISLDSYSSGTYYLHLKSGKNKATYLVEITR